jgi:outer membrane protein
MKKVNRILTLLVLLLCLSTITMAQKPLKIGYIDFNTLITAMPGIDSVKAKLQKYQQGLSDQLDAMRGEFENKYLDYQSKSSGMSDLIKQTKEKELADLQSRIDGFQQKAQQDLQGKQQEFLQPIVDKAKTAIKEISKENGFTIVLNSIEDVLLYNEGAEDIMPLVKKKLGIE